MCHLSTSKSIGVAPSAACGRGRFRHPLRTRGGLQGRAAVGSRRSTASSTERVFTPTSFRPGCRLLVVFGSCSAARTGGALPRLQRKAPDLRGPGADVVEMAGIEPASDDIEPGLLRAHSAPGFLGPHPPRRRSGDRAQLPCGVLVVPATRTTSGSSLGDARIRVGSIPGLTDLLTPRRRERSRCSSVRHLLVCAGR